VKKSVVAFADRGVEHEVDGVVFADWVVVVRNRKLHQLDAAAATEKTSHTTE